MRWRNRFRRPMLVTGGSGFLGRHLLDAPGDWDVVAPTHDMIDLLERDRVRELVRSWKPQVVVHLAYQKQRRQIVDVSRNVAEAAAAAGAHLIHLSSDLVFGGGPEPYREADPPSPVIDYGRDKLDAERAVLGAVPGAAVVRTSLLYGTERASAAQLDARAAVEGTSSMRCFTDEIRCPTHAADVAAAIVALADGHDAVGVLHVAGPRPMSRAEFAELDAAWYGLPAGRVPTSTIAESGQVRPGRVVLDSSRAASLGITCCDPREVLRRA